MFSRTSLASCDFFTMTSLSFCAWCMRLTLDRFLYETPYCKDFFVSVRFLYMSTYLADVKRTFICDNSVCPSFKIIRRYQMK